jgi:alanine racemase (EC 5.1.1.1)
LINYNITILWRVKISFYRSFAEINLENLKHNVKNLYSFSKKKIFAVVKADAYGHNAVLVSKYLQNWIL